MCLGIPVEVIQVKDKETATVAVGGVRKDVSIQLLGGVKKGDYVLLHAGFAIQKIDEKEAQETLKILREMAEIK